MAYFLIFVLTLFLFCFYSFTQIANIFVNKQRWDSNLLNEIPIYIMKIFGPSLGANLQL